MPRRTAFAIGVLILLGLAACSPPALFPDGPTPIPTLAPVTEIPSAVEPTSEASFAILSYPARPPSAAEGQLIFHSSCSRCHGEDGTGAVPGSRNFRDLDYIRSETPANFYTAITEGRGEMPAYQDQLSSDERWDVAFYIWRLSTSAQTLSDGKQIFDESCASCHGEDGSGELLGSADFTDLRQMDNLAPRDLYLTVTQGRGSMPAWQSLLSVDERWAVIDYLRSFTYEPGLEFEVAAVGPEDGTPALTAACSADQSNPFAWDSSEAVQAGQSVYLVQCALCHGPDGSGGLPQTPDFTSVEVSDAVRSEPGRYFCSVSEGLGVMPAFGGSLTEEQRWQVLTYIESLGP